MDGFTNIGEVGLSVGPPEEVVAPGLLSRAGFNQSEAG